MTRHINNHTRWKVLQRDNFTCFYCGRRAPFVQLQIDHVKSKSKGGCNRLYNLVTACYDCNSGKGSDCGSVNLLKTSAFEYKVTPSVKLRQELEIIKSYVKYLEINSRRLKAVLDENNIPFNENY